MPDEPVESTPINLSDSPFDVADAAIDLRRAQEVAVTEFELESLLERDTTGDPAIFRIVARRNAAGDLTYLVSIFDQDDLDFGVANVIVDAQTSIGNIHPNRSPITSELPPNPLDVNNSVISDTDLQATAIAAVGSGEVNRIVVIANPAGRVIYVVRVAADGVYHDVTIDGNTGSVLNVNQVVDTTQDED